MSTYIGNLAVLEQTCFMPVLFLDPLAPQSIQRLLSGGSNRPCSCPPLPFHRLLQLLYRLGAQARPSQIRVVHGPWLEWLLD